MNKIIDGKKYDTDTAKEIYSAENGKGYTDFHYYSETLYQKKTKEFFLLIDGGAMTCCAVSCGDNCWSGSSFIRPISDETAKEWLAKNVSASRYEEIFGNVEE